MRGFFGRHNRAITLISGAAIIARLFFSGKDISVGILIGGLLPVIYFDIMQRDLGQTLAGSGIRGKLFVSFLLRYGMMALGLGVALWISRRTFLSAVAALVVVYIGEVVTISLRLPRTEIKEAVSEPSECRTGDGSGSSNGNLQ